jgi:hypothetical protein
VILAKPDVFTKEHYEAQRGLAPAPLCELVVHCLELVSQLCNRGLAFRFKGGNSLLVLLQDPQRFSIDVDIVTTEPKDRLIALVGEIADGCEAFTRWESRQPKTKPWLPLISFKLFFESVYPQAEQPFVMLDVVLEPAPYEGIVRQVRCGSLYESGERVEVPSVSGLIGDKLLAIGPSTLGIPIGKGKEAQRLKHVFDVALLSRQGHDPEAVRRAIHACQVQEERIQGRNFSWAEIAQDTIRFCSEPLALAVPPSIETLEPGSYLREIVQGFDDFRRHLLRADYGWSEFRRDCGAVADLVGSLGVSLDRDRRA